MALLTGGRLQGRIPKESRHFTNLGKGHGGGGEGKVQQGCSTVLRLHMALVSKELGFGTRAQRLPAVGREALESTE